MVATINQLTMKEKKELALFFMLTPIVILIGLLSYIKPVFFLDSMKDLGHLVSVLNALFGLAIPLISFFEGKVQKPHHIVFLSGLCSAAMITATFVIGTKEAPSVFLSAVGYLLAVIVVFLGIKYMNK